LAFVFWAKLKYLTLFLPRKFVIMSRILYYLILLPLSRLPLSALYKLSDFLYLVLYRGLGYRKKVVYGNLRHSFPEKTAAEIKAIADEFYRFLFDLMVETIRLFSMPESELVAHCEVNDIDVFDRFAQQGQQVIIAGGHYGNWELAAMAICIKIPHTGVAIYRPLKNKFLNDKLQQSRGRFGMEMVPTPTVKTFYAENHQRTIATIFGTDQAPSNERGAYWTMFLNQETPVFLGAERYAKQYDCPVIFLRVRRVKRGYFTVDAELVSEHPAQTQEGEITEAHTRILEKIIRANPEYWLWTHRRWKRTRPEDMPLHGTNATTV